MATFKAGDFVLWRPNSECPYWYNARVNKVYPGARYWVAVDGEDHVFCRRFNLRRVSIHTPGEKPTSEMTPDEIINEAARLSAEINPLNTYAEEVAFYERYRESIDFCAVAAWIDDLRQNGLGVRTREEAQREREEFAEREAELEYQERMSRQRDRDEWDDLWDDRARSVGAVRF